MFDPSKITDEGCMICQRVTPYEPERLRMTAFGAFGAYGLKRLYICEHCDAIAEKYVAESDQMMKTFVEKFMAEHCKIKD